MYRLNLHHHNALPGYDRHLDSCPNDRKLNDLIDHYNDYVHIPVAMSVLGYLLAIVSAAVVVTTGQPPWFLMIALIAIATFKYRPSGWK